MPKCRFCGGYASVGKDICPFDQIRHGEFVKGKWVVDASAAIAKILVPDVPENEDGQIGFELGDENEE